MESKLKTKNFLLLYVKTYYRLPITNKIFQRVLVNSESFKNEGGVGDVTGHPPTITQLQKHSA